VSLRKVITEEIGRCGPMPFSRYMELCLYHPELGYYSRPAERFGKGVDFYTSSDVHAVFGRLLARQFEEMWRMLDSPGRIDILELGPGRGLFARDVLDWSSKRFPEFAHALRYVLVEQSPALREKLQNRLSEYVARGKAEICETLEYAAPTLFPHLIVFANEFFDALPVDIIDHRGSVRVVEQDGILCEQFFRASSAELDFLDRYSVHPEADGRVEASLAALDWMRRITAAFAGRTGFAVFIDYGYTREQQLAGRHRDTLMTYRKHRTHMSPYDAPGEQDITAHVNFTALSGAGRDLGLLPLGLVTQTQFLMGVGEASQFAEAFLDCRLAQEQAKVALQLKHLLSPAGMGEVFQVLVQCYGVRKEKAAQLSGLKFVR
jgi:SAM-dependent MidA family methyltransferase